MSLTKQEKKTIINDHQKKVNLIFKDVDYWRLIDKASKMEKGNIIEQISDSGLRLEVAKRESYWPRAEQSLTKKESHSGCLELLWMLQKKVEQNKS